MFYGDGEMRVELAVGGGGIFVWNITDRQTGE